MKCAYQFVVWTYGLAEGLNQSRSLHLFKKEIQDVTNRTVRLEMIIKNEQMSHFLRCFTEGVYFHFVLEKIKLNERGSMHLVSKVTGFRSLGTVDITFVDEKRLNHITLLLSVVGLCGQIFTTLRTHTPI